jgi:L-galactono-1,4-lactone dehydrogenase
MSPHVLPQVSAHGTGATIPPVDEQVVALKLVTPAGGILELNAEDDPELFKMARVGLGCLGVVTELTLQAVRAQKLQEKTFVATAKEVAANHAKWLRGNKHLRYMWLPYTDSVVVVQVRETAAIVSNTDR